MVYMHKILNRHYGYDKIGNFTRFLLQTQSSQSKLCILSMFLNSWSMTPVERRLPELEGDVLISFGEGYQQTDLMSDNQCWIRTLFCLMIALPSKGCASSCSFKMQDFKGLKI